MGVWEEKRALRFLPENPGGVPTCLCTASTLKHAHIFPTFLPSAFSVIPQICGLPPHVLGAVSELSCPTPYLARETEAGKAPPHLNSGAEQGEGWVSERCWLHSRALWECAGQQDSRTAGHGKAVVLHSDLLLSPSISASLDVLSWVVDFIDYL